MPEPLKSEPIDPGGFGGGLPQMPNVMGILWSILIGLLAWLAGNIVRPLGVAIGNAIPVVGHWFSDAVSALVHEVEREFLKLAGDAAGTLINVIVKIETLNRGLATWVTHAIESSFNAVVHIIQVTVPWVLQHVQDLYNALYGFVVAQVTQLEALIDWRIKALTALLLAWIESAVSAAVAQFNQQFKGVEDAIGALWATVTAAIGTALNAAQAYTDARVHQAEINAASASAGVGAEAAREAQALRDRIDQAAHDAEAFAATLVGQAERGAAIANASTLATALAVSGAIALSVDQIRNLECIKLCAPLSLVGASIEALDLAALLLLVADAAHDPKGTAGFLSSTLQPVVDDGVALYRGLGGR